MRDNLAIGQCFALLPLPAHIKDRYDRLVLATEARHIAGLDSADDGALIVSSDWLLWQQCLNEDRHAVHLDLGILDWDGKQTGHDHMVRANDWIFSEGRDMTLFRGVSLGQKFFRRVSWVISDYCRLTAMLDAHIGRFRPKELIFYDCRTEDGFLDTEGRVAVAAAAARRSRVVFTDRRQPSFVHESGSPLAGSLDRPGEFREPLKSRLKGHASKIYIRLLARISRMKRKGAKRRPGVLLMATHITLKPLIEEFRGEACTPMFLGRWMPHRKNIVYWIGKLKNGILPIESPHPELSPEDIATLEKIENDIEQNLIAPQGTRETEIFRFVKKWVAGSGRLRKMAREVKWAERLLDEYQPDLVVTDGLNNPTVATVLELMKNRGKMNAVTWHGPYIEDVKMDVFGCDPRMRPLADFSLTWGQAHEDWLDGIGAKTHKIRTGNLVASNYRDLPRAENRGDVMVLQYILTNHDFVTPMSYEFFYFVEVIRMLNDLGYSSIRLRFHPGTEKRKYYERLMDFFDLRCDLNDTGSFRENVQWADFVIGPVSSGAMQETIASNRTYFPVSLAPHPNNFQYLTGTEFFKDLDSLRRRLESGTPLDQKKFLENFTSLQEIPNAARRTWEAIEDILQHQEKAGA